MTDEGIVKSEIKDGVGSVIFGHPKSNSLPGNILKGIAKEIEALGNNPEVKVVLLRSEGDRTFCAGASFDEFKAIKDVRQGQEFFMGFGSIILAIKRCPKFVVCRVQGKVVGGGVGLVAASDYALATAGSAIRLSELAIGIGPFIIGPAVQRKIGMSAFGIAAIDADWHDAHWAKDHGLYAQIYETVKDLDQGVRDLTSKLAGYNPAAMAKLKSVLWEGTESWETLLPTRAGFTAELVLSDYVKNAVSKIQGK